MSELNPCPFCGGDAEITTLEDEGSFISCKSCGCCTRIQYDRKENLESDWNNRYPSWTSVFTKLPDSPATVLIAFIETNHLESWSCVDTGYYSNGKWFNGHARVFDVTDWMPIPPLPQK